MRQSKHQGLLQVKNECLDVAGVGGKLAINAILSRLECPEVTTPKTFRVHLVQ